MSLGITVFTPRRDGGASRYDGPDFVRPSDFTTHDDFFPVIMSIVPVIAISAFTETYIVIRIPHTHQWLGLPKVGHPGMWSRSLSIWFFLHFFFDCFVECFLQLVVFVGEEIWPRGVFPCQVCDALAEALIWLFEPDGLQLFQNPVDTRDGSGHETLLLKKVFRMIHMIMFIVQTHHNGLVMANQDQLMVPVSLRVRKSMNTRMG